MRRPSSIVAGGLGRGVDGAVRGHGHDDELALVDV